MSDIPELQAYAAKAAAAVTAVTDRRATREELYGHLLDAYEAELDGGRSHDEAVAAAIERLGDPAEYAASLSKAHRGPLTPKSVALIVVAAIITIIVVFALLIAFFWFNSPLS